MRFLLPSTIVFLLWAPAGAQLANASGDDSIPEPKTVADTVQAACERLIRNQENYEPDKPVGRLPEEELDLWQTDERARLEKLREEAQEEGAREWPYEGVYRVGDGRIPAGYRVGGSAIVCTALLEAPGMDEERRAAIERSIEFMLDALDDDRDLKPRRQTNYDVRGWGHIYALNLFLRALETEFVPRGKLARRMKKAVPHLIECLEKGTVQDGGWNYAGRGVSPFMTGAALLALYQARAQGFSVPDELVEEALDVLEAGRGESRAFAYSGPLKDENEPMEGACARSAIAELSLYRAGRSDVDGLRRAIDGFFEERNWQELLVRKSQQGTHAKPYGVAPYYFFFGHTYAAWAVEHLPEEERPAYRARMRELLWRTIEEDEAWNDRIFPRTESYSTAMSVLALIAPELPTSAEWTSKKRRKGR